jgi:hypothetical protein
MYVFQEDSVRLYVCCCVVKKMMNFFSFSSFSLSLYFSKETQPQFTKKRNLNSQAWVCMCVFLISTSYKKKNIYIYIPSLGELNKKSLSLSLYFSKETQPQFYNKLASCCVFCNPRIHISDIHNKKSLSLSLSLFNLTTPYTNNNIIFTPPPQSIDTYATQGFFLLLCFYFFFHVHTMCIRYDSDSTIHISETTWLLLLPEFNQTQQCIE